MCNEATASDVLFISTCKLPAIFIASFIARVVFLFMMCFRSVSWLPGERKVHNCFRKAEMFSVIEWRISTIMHIITLF